MQKIWGSDNYARDILLFKGFEGAKEDIKKVEKVNSTEDKVPGLPKKVNGDSHKMYEEGELYINPEGSMKASNNKVRFELIPAQCIRVLAEILTHGAKKYSPNNWRKHDAHQCLGALQRHLNARAEGEVLDPDSGLPHTGHAFCNAMFLLYFDLIGKKVNYDVPDEEQPAEVC